MSDAPTPQPAFPRWIGTAVVALLAGQLSLLWLQGMQLNRQHHDLSALQDDLQALVESLDQGSSGPAEEGDPMAPARHRGRSATPYLRVRQEKPEPRPEGEPDPAMKDASKELKDVKDSAQKAVADARDIRSKLSLEENARKAEEQAKIKQARAAWELWAVIGAAVVVGALLLRGWLRAREE